jgi:hypothetical protein
VARKGKHNVHKRVTKRRAKLQRCGSRCYLDPDPKKPRYPVCDIGSCDDDCYSLMVAYRRARQQGDQKIARKAVKRGKHKACEWARGK